MTRKKQHYRFGVVLLAAVMTLGNIGSASAADAAAGTGGKSASSSSVGADTLSVGSAPAIGRVDIGGGSFFEIRNLMLLPEQGNKTVTFTVTMNNGGNTDLQFIDYWARLKTKSGNQITVRVFPQDKDKNRVTAKSSQNISFYATVNESTALTDLAFDLIKWDFSQPNFERTIGQIAVPDNYNIVAADKTAQTIQMNGNPIKTEIKKLLRSKNEKNYTPTIVLKLENTGSRSITVPGYQYLLATREGYMYPLDARGNKELVIDPKVTKEIELSGSVPVSVSTEGWQLIVVQNASDLKLNLPIAYFALPAVSEADAADVGKSYKFSNKEGTYTAKLDAVQRLPWEDEDLLNASLTLSNQGEASLPFPELGGYFLLDDKVKVEAKLVRSEKVIGLTPNASAPFQFVGRVPFTTEFKKIKLVLQEKTASSGNSSSTGGTSASATETSQGNDLLEFTHSAEMMNIPYHNIGEAYKTSSLGRSVNYKVRSLFKYTGSTTNTLAVQVDATNLEKRYNSVSRLAAHFKVADGTVFPANVAEIKSKVSPGSSALLFVTANVPKGFISNGLQLVIGDAVTEGKLTEGDKKPDAYVNAAAFWLPDDTSVIKPDFKNIELLPYKLSISNIRTGINQDGANVTFDYELIKDLLMQTSNEGRRLVLSVEDEEGKVNFSEEFDFSSLDGVGASGSEQAAGQAVKDSKIKLGKKRGARMEVNDRDMIYYVSKLKKYNFNVYDSYQGQKRLIASKQIGWFELFE